MSDVCKDGLGLYYIIVKFIQVDLPMHLYMDKQGAMFTVSNLETNKRPKHVGFRFHMTRDYNKGTIQLNCIITYHNIADIMTKALHRVKTPICHEEAPPRNGYCTELNRLQ